MPDGAPALGGAGPPASGGSPGGATSVGAQAPKGALGAAPPANAAGAKAPTITVGKKIPMAQPQLVRALGGGMQTPAALRGEPPYLLETLVPGTFQRIGQVLDPDPDVAATPACPITVPRGTCPEFRKTGACSRTNNSCTRDHVCAVCVGPNRFALVRMMSKSTKLNEQITRRMLTANRQQAVARNVERGARLDEKRERAIKLEQDRQSLQLLRAGTAAYQDPATAQALYLARKGLTPAVLQQYEAASERRASMGTVAMSQPRAYSIAPEGATAGYRQRSLSHLVMPDAEPEARNPRVGARSTRPVPETEEWGQEIHPALQRRQDHWVRAQARVEAEILQACPELRGDAPRSELDDFDSPE